MPTMYTHHIKKLILLVITVALGISMSLSAQARKLYTTNDHGQNSYQQNSVNYITVYEDCDYRGKSRSLDIGEYADVRKLNIRNDSISSLRIPKGLQVSLYEDERFRGESIIITNDIGCLNHAWNDKVSSLRVSPDHRQHYSNSTNRHDDYRSQGRDTTNLTRGIKRIEISEGVLFNSQNSGWVLKNRNGNIDNYIEESRDKQRIFLKDRRSPQKVEINLATYKVLFISRTGRIVSSPIRYAGQDRRYDSHNQSDRRYNNHPSSGTIKGRCINYKVYTRGGEGGIRFNDHNGFHRYDKKAKNGHLCHDGTLIVELSKTEPNTEVILRVEGKNYVFGRHEQHDELLNGWYRKRITLKRR